MKKVNLTPFFAFANAAGADAINAATAKSLITLIRLNPVDELRIRKLNLTPFLFVL